MHEKDRGGCEIKEKGDAISKLDKGGSLCLLVFACNPKITTRNVSIMSSLEAGKMRGELQGRDLSNDSFPEVLTLSFSLHFVINPTSKRLREI